MSEETKDRVKLAGFVALVVMVATAVATFVGSTTRADVRMDELRRQVDRIEQSITELERLTGDLSRQAARLDARINAIERITTERVNGVHIQGAANE